jgi:hypothetical protein
MNPDVLPRRQDDRARRSFLLPHSHDDPHGAIPIPHDPDYEWCSRCGVPMPANHSDQCLHRPQLLLAEVS